ncbi:MAG: hypothetical protein U9R00_02020, partial [Patescibacteria group bacterium]|nr:hypothetical protein [Patescibacteria group bacterium]
LNYKKKVFEFNMVMLIGLAMLSFIRGVYCFIIKSYFIAIPDMIGILISLVLFYQYYIYVTKKKT